MKATIKKSSTVFLAMLVISIIFQGCNSNNLCNPMQNKGIGPIDNIKLGEIDLTMAKEGKVIYDQLCTVCHNEIKQMEGPAHKGIINRRTPEWIMNMMMNPSEMAKNDPIAKILAERVNGIEMADMNLSKEEARKILEYFRTL